MKKKEWLIAAGIIFLLIITGVFGYAYELEHCNAFICVYQ